MCIYPFNQYVTVCQALENQQGRKEIQMVFTFCKYTHAKEDRQKQVNRRKRVRELSVLKTTQSWEKSWSGIPISLDKGSKKKVLSEEWTCELGYKGGASWVKS